MQRITIRISRRFSFLLLALSLLAATTVDSRAQTGKTVKGTVTDGSGETLPGVSIRVQGTSAGTVTDIDGKHSVGVPTEKSKLEFSMIGYTTETVAVGSKTEINVALTEKAEQLDEVVVVGYGGQKKVSLTGSVAAITSKEIVTTKSNNLQNALAGKLAGVKVVQGSSEPGTFETSFSVRGMGDPTLRPTTNSLSGPTQAD